MYISILTLYEFEFRFANAPEEMKQRIRTQLITMRDDFETLPLSESGASIFGELKKALYAMRGMKPENLKKHNIDLMLAGNAIAIQAIMVSADSLYADLQKLDSRLRCEDWTVI